MKVIGLWSDSHNFPSVPLMKLSAYHKGQGDIVELLQEEGEYDLVYFSKVFSESSEPDFCIFYQENYQGW